MKQITSQPHQLLFSQDTQLDRLSQCAVITVRSPVQQIVQLGCPQLLGQKANHFLSDKILRKASSEQEVQMVCHLSAFPIKQKTRVCSL